MKIEFDKLMYLIGLVIGLLSGAIIVLTITNTCDNRQITKDNNIIESTKHSNDSIRLEIKHIDKDKNEKIIEVKGLNNDSTYKLFKRLIAE